MPQYILLIRVGPQGSAGMLANGREGAERAKESLASLGATNIQHYPVIGEYELVMIADFPDEATLIAATHQGRTQGFQVEELQVYSFDVLDQALAKLEALPAEANPDPGA